MAKKHEKKELVKKNWVSRFSIRGVAKINQKSFSFDQRSDKGWIYNRLNFGIDCGADIGTVYVQAMGGYSSKGNSVIYVHGKDENNKDDFENRYTIDFEDRNDPSVISEIGDTCFSNVYLEKDVKENLSLERFLSDYDLIKYLSEHLEDGMCISVSGTMQWQEYNGNVNAQRNIQRVTLVDNDPDKYHANFTQTVLIDRDSFNKEKFDKDKNVFYITGHVLERVKSYSGHNLVDDNNKSGKLIPLPVVFEYEPPKNKDVALKAIKKLFQPKKGVTQITFDGDYICSGAVVQTTIDDLPDDIKEMIELGIYTEEDALAKCADNGSRENRMILRSPQIKNVVDDDGNKSPAVQLFENMYDDEDLIIEFPDDESDGFMKVDDSDEEAIPFDEKKDGEDEDSLDWLSQL